VLKTNNTLGDLFLLEKHFFKNKFQNDVFLLGVNYWPSSSAIRMWSRWDPEEIEEDIIQMKELGMNCFRPFLFMPDFTDSSGGVRARMTERLHTVLTLCEKHELYSMITFIVGHMSGENWDVPWRKDKNFITDSNIYQITEKYIQAIVRETKHYSTICAWLLSNELPNYIEETDPVPITEWVKNIIWAIKTLDPERPVSIGDGAWSPEIIGEQTGFHLRKLNKYQDFVGLHYYPRGMSPWHHTYTTAFRLSLAKEWGKPVIVEEFGTSTTLCSEENQASYYRTVFYSALINGARGVLSWCLNDFDFIDERPYSHHPYEEHFGIVRTDKSLKPAAEEFWKFNDIITEISGKGFQKVENPVGLFIPSNFYYEYPFQFQPEFKQVYDLYLETFSLLKRGNLDVKIMFEPAQELEKGGDYTHVLTLDPGEIPFLFIPRMKLMTKQTRIVLEAYLKKGGVVYFSFAHDSWVPDWHTLAGIEMDCKFGVPDFYDKDCLEISSSGKNSLFDTIQPFTIPLNRASPEFGFCPVTKWYGESILEDPSRSPFLLRHSVGKGTVWFSPFPLEMLALNSPSALWKASLSHMYRSMYTSINPRIPFNLEGDGLEMGLWKNESRYLCLIFNHAGEKRTGRLTVNIPRWSIEAVSIPYQQAGSESMTFTLDKKSVCTIKISGVFE
jgi:hypothetical protein